MNIEELAKELHVLVEKDYGFEPWGEMHGEKQLFIVIARTVARKLLEREVDVLSDFRNGTFDRERLTEMIASRLNELKQLDRTEGAR